VAGLREMGRVVRPGGVVAACVWDHAGGHSPVAPLWQIAHSLDPDVLDESDFNGAREGHLAELFAAAGLGDIQDTALTATREYDDFESWWEPFTYGVGPAGAYLLSRDAGGRAALHDGCQELLGSPPFMIAAKAWAARGVRAG